MDEFHYLFTTPLIVSTFIALLTFSFAWRWLTSSSPRKTKNSPPSPPALPIIGNLHQLGKLHHRSLHQLSKKYGPLMLLHLGSKPTLVVSSADVAKQILKTHDLAFSDKPALTTFKKIFYDLNDVLTLPYGDQWRKLRSVFVHDLLSNTRVKAFSPVRDEEIRILVNKIRSRCDSSVNLTDTFVSFANDLICRAAFGKKRMSETEHGKKFLDAMGKAVGLLSKVTLGDFVPWLGWINRLNGFNAELDRCASVKDDVMDAVIEEHLKVGPTGSGDSFVDILLGIYKGNTPGVSIDLISVKALILDVFGAGTETSATTLVWIMTDLIKHPAVMKKLQEEVRHVMQEKQHITDEDIRKMQYLKAVVKEAFRYHPTITMVVHSSREYVNLMGCYDIPPKTMVMINTWAIGRDPSYWDEPERYMPERFLNSTVDTKGFDFQLIPFGAGRRICPGIGFAETSIEHTIANLVHKFDWALPDGMKGEDLDVTEKYGISLRKKLPLMVVPTSKC
ncbi:hypothetical protein ABFS83_09G011700 [Erythranthe nasuta]